MNDDNIVGAQQQNGKVQIHWREWDGIDRPEHYYSSGMHPNRARNFAASLIKAADEADIYLGQEKERTLEKLEQQKTALEVAIARLKGGI